MSRVSPSSHEASLRMARVRQKGTDAELSLRKALYARGLHYRLHVPLLTKPRRVADIIFSSARVAIFVDGCFWHGCPEHATWPKQNAEFWREKIEANQRRDADTNDRLRSLGWTVLRFWSHEPPTEAARTVARAIASADSKHRAASPGAIKKN